MLPIFIVALHWSFFFQFQVLVEGVWGNNRVSGFIAIDDVTFFNGDCDGKIITMIKLN